MTSNELYEVALSLLPTNKGEDNNNEQYVLGWVNLLLAECMIAENSIRQSRHMPTLDAPPRVYDLDQTIPMDDALVSVAFPYGLAEHLCKDDNDSYWAQDFRARYITAVSDCLKATPEPIVDVYGGRRCE